MKTLEEKTRETNDRKECKQRKLLRRKSDSSEEKNKENIQPKRKIIHNAP